LVDEAGDRQGHVEPEDRCWAAAERRGFGGRRLGVGRRRLFLGVGRRSA
jgi:hypothetical protein